MANDSEVSSCDRYTVSDSVYIVNASITLILSTLAILGNSTIIIIFALNKKARNMNNRAVILLATADLMRGTIVMIPKTYNHFTIADDLTGPLCTITACTSAFTFFFNPMVLAMIAIIRYFIIVPWTKRSRFLTQTKVRIIFMIIFMISMLFSILPYLGIGIYNYSIYHGVCFTDWSKPNVPFRTIFYSFVVGIAFPVLTYCYLRLLIILKNHNQNMRNLTPSVVFTNSNITEQDIPECLQKTRSLSALRYEDIIKLSPVVIRKSKKRSKSTLNFHKVTSKIENHSSSKMQKSRIHSSSIVKLNVKIDAPFDQQRDDISRKHSHEISVNVKTKCTIDVIMKENKKTTGHRQVFGKSLTKQEYQMTKTMIMIFFAYVICWFPAAVVNIIALTDTCNVPAVWYFIIVTMVELKSVLNPFIYGLGNRQYRIILRQYYDKYLRFR